MLNPAHVAIDDDLCRRYHRAREWRGCRPDASGGDRHGEYSQSRIRSSPDIAEGIGAASWALQNLASGFPQLRPSAVMRTSCTGCGATWFAGCCEASALRRTSSFGPNAWTWPLASVITRSTPARAAGRCATMMAIPPRSRTPLIASVGQCSVAFDVEIGIRFVEHHHERVPIERACKRTRCRCPPERAAPRFPIRISKPFGRLRIMS